MYTPTHAAIKYRFKVLSLSPGEVIPHITALLTQGPQITGRRRTILHTLLCAVGVLRLHL